MIAQDFLKCYRYVKVGLSVSLKTHLNTLRHVLSFAVVAFALKVMLASAFGVVIAGNIGNAINANNIGNTSNDNIIVACVYVALFLFMLHAKVSYKIINYCRSGVINQSKLLVRSFFVIAALEGIIAIAEGILFAGYICVVFGVLHSFNLMVLVRLFLAMLIVIAPVVMSSVCYSIIFSSSASSGVLMFPISFAATLPALFFASGVLLNQNMGDSLLIGAIYASFIFLLYSLKGGFFLKNSEL